MPEPLSAGFMTMFVLSCSCLRAVLCLFGKLLVAFCLRLALRASSKTVRKAMMALFCGGVYSDGGQNFGFGAWPSLLKKCCDKRRRRSKVSKGCWMKDQSSGSFSCVRERVV